MLTKKAAMLSAWLAIGCGCAGTAFANDLSYFTTVKNTDVASFGIGKMRDVGTGSLSVSGLSGTVTSAYLFWHGPTNSLDPTANAAVSFNGNAITGTNIGFSQDNFWGYTNSQGYRANVTSLVTGNGAYSLSDFIKGANGSIANINGASLIVFYDDGNAANNHDVVLFDGNDANFDNPYDALGWNAHLNGIDYSGGPASMSLHVSDGQFVFDDGTMSLNGTPIATGHFFEGANAQLGTGNDKNGSLWDINTYDVTSFLSPGLNNLALTITPTQDALSLVVAQFTLPVGAAPPPPGVPEPSAWVMMLGGFGLIGSALRLQRRSAATA